MEQIDSNLDPSGFPQDPLSWIPPEPSPQDRASARILARLIQFGYTPASAPELSPSWQRAYDDVFLIRSRPRGERLRAFFESFEPGDPNFMLIHRAINDAMPDTDDRLEKNRVLYTADDALKPPPKLEWCVEDLLATPSLTMLVGNPGTKKTYLAMDLAVSTALGKPWLGRKVSQGPVLFVDEETGLHQLWARFNASLKAHESGWGVPLNFVSLGGYNLRDEAEADVLIHRALSVNARLIIIDSLANLMRGSGESNLATIQPVLFNLRRMAEYCNAAVLVSHHTNRQGFFRGSSAISAACDLMLSIESEPEESLITIRTLKARFFAPPPFAANANFETLSDSSKRFLLSVAKEEPAPVSPAAEERILIASSPLASTVLDFLKRNEKATATDLFAHLPGSAEGTIRNVLHSLMTAGFVTRADGGSQGKKAVYTVVEAAVKELDND